MAIIRASRSCISVVLAAITLAQSPDGHAAEQRPQQLETVTIAEKLGRTIDLGMSAVDHRGKAVKLGDFFKDDKPVLLTLNYFRCKMLCSLQLNALVVGLKQLGWKPGERFRIVTVSIDPRDTPAIAGGKRAAYLKSLGIPGAEWDFLTARDADIHELAASVGFQYHYVPEEDQYAHPLAIFFLSGSGKVSRYLYGLQYLGRDIRFALLDASAGRIGSPIDRIVLSCYHYDSVAGRYAPFAFGVMRLGGAITAVLLGVFLALLWRRERNRRQQKAQPL